MASNDGSLGADLAMALLGERPCIRAGPDYRCTFECGGIVLRLADLEVELVEDDCGRSNRCGGW